jgi:hypothetical protein
VRVFADLQKRAEHARIDTRRAFTKQLRRRSFQERAQQNRATNDEERITFGGVATRIRAQYFQATFEAADEVGNLGVPPLLIGHLPTEVGKPCRRPPGEHEDRAADRVADLSFKKLAILHRGQEVAEPPQRRSRKR